MQAHGPDLQAIRAEPRELRQALREAGRGGFDEEHVRKVAGRIGDLAAEGAFLRARARAHMRSVLTEEQRVRLERMHRDHGESRNPAPGGSIATAAAAASDAYRPEGNPPPGEID